MLRYALSLLGAALALGAVVLGAPALAHDGKLHAAAAPIPIDPGGPFALVDQHGAPITDRDFRGRYMLVFFGYATCPGICPTGLRGMAAAIDLLGAEGEVVAPILVTIDPERDTPETLGSALAKVHPRLIGLTGSFDALNSAAKAYKVSAKLVGWTLQKQPIVEHGSYIYLMGPDGKFLTIFPPIMDPEEMAAAIRGYLG
jgi:protein SCO1/2